MGGTACCASEMGTACCASYDKHPVEDVYVVCRTCRTLVPTNQSSEAAIDVTCKIDSESEKTYATTIELDATLDATRDATLTEPPTAAFNATLTDLNGSWMYSGT